MTRPEFDKQAATDKLIARGSNGYIAGREWYGYPLAKVDPANEAECGLRVALASLAKHNVSDFGGTWTMPNLWGVRS